MSERILPGVLVIGFLVLVLGLMWFAWRSRRRRDSKLASPFAVPDVLSALLTVPIFYIATTESGRPLERVALPGLGFRSRARFTVADEGLLIDIPGQSPFFIPVGAVTSAGAATWTIDRVVERDGMIVVRWSSATTEFDSYVRVIEQSNHTEILDAIASISHEAADVQPGESEKKA